MKAKCCLVFDIGKTNQKYFLFDKNYKILKKDKVTIPKIKDDYGSGMCNITRCCTDVCPEHIQITDNGIIPLKERVVDRYYDPLIWLWRKLFKKNN